MKTTLLFLALGGLMDALCAAEYRIEPDAGCNQRVDLPNGGVLLPVRYRADPKTRVYTTVVARCTFDGETLTYREHGSEHSTAIPRGLHEPSVCEFQGRYFLTMRGEENGHATHGDGLYLTYSRRGAGNDHVFRHRAPLFIARVDPEKLHVARATEQVLLPETGLDLTGGFAPVNVSAEETWVISTEMAFPETRRAENNRVSLARILWRD